jgi:hypothetical protein
MPITMSLPGPICSSRSSGTRKGFSRLGDENVLSIDVDPQLVSSARTRLDRLGYFPTLASGIDSRPYRGSPRLRQSHCAETYRGRYRRRKIPSVVGLLHASPPAPRAERWRPPSPRELVLGKQRDEAWSTLPSSTAERSSRSSLSSTCRTACSGASGKVRTVRPSPNCVRLTVHGARLFANLTPTAATQSEKLAQLHCGRVSKKRGDLGLT